MSVLGAESVVGVVSVVGVSNGFRALCVIEFQNKSVLMCF